MDHHAAFAITAFAMSMMTHIMSNEFIYTAPIFKSYAHVLKLRNNVLLIILTEP